MSSVRALKAQADQLFPALGHFKNLITRWCALVMELFVRRSCAAEKARTNGPHLLPGLLQAYAVEARTSEPRVAYGLFLAGAQTALEDRTAATITSRQGLGTTVLQLQKPGQNSHRALPS